MDATMRRLCQGLGQGLVMGAVGAATGVASVAFLVLATHAAALSDAGASDAALNDAVGARLIAAYPEQGLRIEGGILIWRDGTRMPLDDGRGIKPLKEWLENPDIGDMFAQPYVPGDATGPPAKDQDPGRARNAAFFDKMYGDCRKGEVAAHLVDVVWLPHKSGQHLKVTSINGVDKKLAAVSNELDQLPQPFDKFLIPSEGAYACRVIAGTARISAHGHGIAIDIATKHAHYWRWAKEGPRPEGDDGAIAYHNEIPMEIVRIFEKHGFIWGGKWHHYDTMHFEYRPELLPADGAAGAK